MLLIWSSNQSFPFCEYLLPFTYLYDSLIIAVSWTQLWCQFLSLVMCSYSFINIVLGCMVKTAAYVFKWVIWMFYQLFVPLCKSAAPSFHLILITIFCTCINFLLDPVPVLGGHSLVKLCNNRFQPLQGIPCLKVRSIQDKDKAIQAAILLDQSHFLTSDQRIMGLLITLPMAF